jgi:molecular chaperone DnaK (HSP70)
MNEWPALQQMLAEALAEFLNRTLPDIGGNDWWQRYVIDQLTASQARVARSIPNGDLPSLDLAALLRIADRNWAEVACKIDVQRDMRSLVIELKSVRNRYAHSSARGVKLEDQLRDVDTALRVLQTIGAETKTLNQVKSIHRRILSILAASFDAAGSDDSEDRSPQRIGSEAGRTDSDDPATRQPNQTASFASSAPLANTQPDADETSSGNWMVSTSTPDEDVARAIGTRTYIGIDFGTSTTVVSAVRLEHPERMATRTLPISQPAALGESISHHLVNTVLAWHNGRILFGRDAYRLRQQLFEGRSVFSSFKMRLGIDIGPTYPETALRRGASAIKIENAKDATREFFKLLRAGISAAIQAQNLPPDIKFAVSVPASFEANQRRDLVQCMIDAGFSDHDICLVDEPNAAFLSFLHASAHGEAEPALIDRVRHGGANILVYDFGAGTCDVSILEVDVSDRGVRSRNLAISRFTALGGDDIDRAIARKVLLPQLMASSQNFSPEFRDIEERLIPRLQPTAERLKLAAIEWLTSRDVTTLEGIRTNAAVRFRDQALPAFSIRGHSLTLNSPSITLNQLADAIEPFVSRYDPAVSTAHVFAPIANALEKSQLPAAKLDAVLFIGGSAANPVVRTAVMKHLPHTVRAIIPRDLRTHVSMGAALHSLGFHAFGMDLIRPITSEPIYVITKGGGLETAIPAGAEVPSSTPFVTRLRVERSGQTVVELPICVGSESKLLGLLRVESISAGGFDEDAEVIVRARITHEKLLDVEAEVAGLRTQAGLLNPLANRELSVAETRMLEAKQKFNQDLLESAGHPSVEVVLEYAQAAIEAEAFEVAADMYIAAERIDADQDHATNICYAYSRAGRHDLSNAWARTAYERDQHDAAAAYNLSCSVQGPEREELLRTSLRLDPDLWCALLALGRLLRGRGDPHGHVLLERAAAKMEADLNLHRLRRDQCQQLVTLSNELGRNNLAARARARLESLTEDAVYDDMNLAAAMQGNALIKRG